MPNYKSPLRDIRFALNEVLDFPTHYSKLSNKEEATSDLVNAILEESAKFAENVLSPLNNVGDSHGCQWNNGHVTTPPGFKGAYKQFIEGGWLSLAQEPKWGGQGLPSSLSFVISELMSSANHAWNMYPSLSLGAIKTINAHGTEQQKSMFLPSLIDGSWSGTMCLTEAHCGSDLGLLRTKAQPQDDGSYRINGSKIFISAGEHDLTENIIHLVLARLPDAPQGVKGISLFVVPKLHVKEDGTLSNANSVSCGSIEKKMGINGNATCVLNFDNALGYLVGGANKGMNCMFTFINESRLGVAQQGQAHTEATFQGSVTYARERLQMRASKRIDTQHQADPIIVHPDIRRMLLTQKVFAEGGRLLNYYCAKQVDLAYHAQDPAIRQVAEQRLALLTPIAKGFLSETGQEAASLGVQVFGGHGYVGHSGMEQISRDVRITSIYEGTTAIQALDLLGRKILASNSQLLKSFLVEIEVFCAAEQGYLSEFTQPLRQHMRQWLELTQHIDDSAQYNPDEIGSVAVDYLMFSGYVTLAYFWAISASTAKAQLYKATTESDFYKAKLQAARFYFQRILPRTQSLITTITSGSDNLMAMDESHFIF